MTLVNFEEDWAKGTLYMRFWNLVSFPYKNIGKLAQRVFKIVVFKSARGHNSSWKCLNELKSAIMCHLTYPPTLMESNYSAFCDVLWIYSDFCLAKAHFEPDSRGKKSKPAVLGTLDASNRPETVETGLIRRSLPYKRVKIYIKEF